MRQTKWNDIRPVGLPFMSLGAETVVRFVTPPVEYQNRYRNGPLSIRYAAVVVDKADDGLKIFTFAPRLAAEIRRHAMTTGVAPEAPRRAPSASGSGAMTRCSDADGGPAVIPASVSPGALLDQLERITGWMERRAMGVEGLPTFRRQAPAIMELRFAGQAEPGK